MDPMKPVCDEPNVIIPMPTLDDLQMHIDILDAYFCNHDKESRDSSKAAESWDTVRRAAEFFVKTTQAIENNYQKE